MKRRIEEDKIRQKVAPENYKPVRLPHSQIYDLITYMKTATIAFLIKDDSVYLAEKLERLGKGNLNGYGGKVQEGETAAQAAVREIKEEASITVEEADLEKVAIVQFFEGGREIFECHIYFVRKWQGEPVASEEMGKPELFQLAAMPFDRMWASDRQWIALIIAGKKIKAKAYYAEGNKTVEKFEYEEVDGL